MKISKTRVGIAVVTVVLAVGCVAGAGCAAQQLEPSNAVAGTETTPKLMPAQHQKYVDRAAYKCYRCHGASVQGNPTAKNAVAMPNGRRHSSSIPFATNVAAAIRLIRTRSSATTRPMKRPKWKPGRKGLTISVRLGASEGRNVRRNVWGLHC